MLNQYDRGGPCIFFFKGKNQLPCYLSMFLCFLEPLLSQKWRLTPNQQWRSGKVSFA